MRRRSEEYATRDAFLRWQDLWPRWLREFADPRAHGRLFTRRAGREGGPDRDMWMVAVDRGAKVTVVFVHGGGGRGEQWLPVMDELLKPAEGGGVAVNAVAVDLVGHGRSAKPVAEEFYAGEEMVADVAALVELVRTECVVLVGHSYGSSLAMLAAPRARVQRLVLLGSSGDRLKVFDSPMLRCCLCFFDCIRPLLSRASAASMFGPAFPADLRARETLVANQNPFHALIPLARQAATPTEAQERALDMPALLLHGADDSVTPLAGAQLLQSRLPRAELRAYAGARHNVMMEEGPAIARELARFAAA